MCLCLFFLTCFSFPYQCLDLHVLASFLHLLKITLYDKQSRWLVESSTALHHLRQSVFFCSAIPVCVSDVFRESFPDRLPCRPSVPRRCWTGRRKRSCVTISSTPPRDGTTPWLCVRGTRSATSCSTNMVPGAILSKRKNPSCSS